MSDNYDFLKRQKDELSARQASDEITRLRADLSRAREGLEACKPFTDLAVEVLDDGAPDYREWLTEAKDWLVIFSFGGKSVTLGDLRRARSTLSAITKAEALGGDEERPEQARSGRIEAPPEGPVAWRVKDFADGWILCHSEAQARDEAEGAGNLIEPLYRMAALSSRQDGQLRDEQNQAATNPKEPTP